MQVNLRRINLNLLTFFEAIYQEQNLTAAAERINVSQPTMSNALSRLRAVFNDQLFIRAGNQMEPTPRARRLAPSILEALARVRDGLLDSVDFDPSIPRTFNIGGVDHVDLIAIPGLVRRNSDILSTMHFNGVSVIEEEYEERLRTNQVDLIIDVGPPSNPELQLHPIFHRYVVPTVRKDHPFAGKRLALEDLPDLRYAILSTRNATRMSTVENYLQEHRCLDNVAVRVSHIRALFDIVRNSDLVGFFPQKAATIRQNELIVLDVDLPPTEITHYIIWHQFQTDDPGNKWLRDQICAIYDDIEVFPDTAM